MKMESHTSFERHGPVRLKARISVKAMLSPDIVGLELAPVEGALPAFTAGAHIDLHLPNGMSRSYSLVNPQGETHRYEIAVKRENGGRGGSAYVHDRFRIGDLIEISPPRNNFLLEERAPHSVLFAGGIGLTPILCMAQRLAALGQSFDLHYGARSRADAIFLDRLEKLSAAGKVRLWFDDETGGERIDMRGLTAQAPEHAHFYCCGPAPMIAGFEEALRDVPPARVHREHFSGSVELGCQGGFEVVLARSDRVLQVPEGQTILDTLLDAGFDVEFSCMEGFCGSCKVGVIEGEVDHRDIALSPAERASGKVMMICCSKAARERLVLDL